MKLYPVLPRRRRGRAALVLAVMSVSSGAWGAGLVMTSPVLSNISVNRIVALPLNSPPINGFVPQVVMGLTSEQNKNDLGGAAVISSSPGGTAYPSSPPYYAVATIDTGSQSHIVSYNDSQIFHFDGGSPDRGGDSTTDIIGASGTETADVSDGMGIYATGFSNASVNGLGALTVTAGTLQGQTNTSILSAEQGSQLPSLVGAPMMAMYQTVISNSQTRRLTVNGTTYRSPSVSFQAVDTPLPAGYSRLTLDLQGPNGVAPTPVFIPSVENFNDIADNPTTPTFWTSMIATSVNVSGNGGSATNQQFLFDTGAEVTVLSEDMAAECGFFTGGPNPSTPDFTIDVQGVGGTTSTVPGFYLPNLSILTNGGRMSWTNVPVAVLDVVDPRDAVGFVPGILGTNLFTDRDLIINGGTTNPSVGISPAITAKWAVDANGNWGEDAKWILGDPNAIDSPANFLSDITAPCTITVDADYTIGSMKFDNSNRYAISGSGHLTLQSSSGPATITVASGSHTISAPLILASDLSVQIGPLASVLTISGDVTATGRNVFKSGSGALELKNLRAASLSVSGGTVRLLANGTATGTSILSSAPVIASTATFDINDNALIVNYGADTTGATRSAIRNLLMNGRNAAPGAPAPWNGLGGITSSFAHTNGNGFNLAVGYVDNAALASINAAGSYTSFGGQTVSSSMILVKMTRGADSNLDGVVDGSDVSIIGTHFNQPGSGQWYFGDFDYSGLCDGNDISVLGTTFGQTSPALSPAQLSAEFGSDFTAAFEAGQHAVAVPEPGVVSVIVAAGGILMRRRRDHRSR